MGGGLEEESRGPDIGGLVIELHDKPILDLTGGVGENGVMARLTADALNWKNIVHPRKKIFFIIFCGHVEGGGIVHMF